MFKPRKTIAKSKLAKQRRKTLFINSVAVVFVIAIFFVTASFVLQIDEITINKVKTEGNIVVTNDELQAFVSKKLEGKYLFLFPKTSIFLYPRKKIEASVLDAFKRISSVEVSFDDFQTINLSVEEREPYALWCRKMDTNEEEQCYFLDKQGFIYTEAPHFTGNTFLRYYGTSTPTSYTFVNMGGPVGNRFLSEEEFKKFNFFIKTLQNIDLEPNSFIVQSEKDIAIYLKGEEKILIGRTQNLSIVLDNIQSFFESDEYIKQDARLLYANFRFGNKVYYKFKK